MRELSSIPLTELKGIGPSRAELFFRQGVETVADLLEYYPRGFIDERERTAIANIQPGTDVLIRARLISEARNYRTGRLTITNARIADESGELPVVWFNQPFMVKNLVGGQMYFFRGKIKENRGRLQLSSPEVRKAEEDLPGLVPIYPLGGGLTQKMVFTATTQALEMLTPEMDMLPASYRQNMLGFSRATVCMHRPKSFSEVEMGRSRLVFDELMIQQLALRKMKAEREKTEKGAVIREVPEKIEALEKTLPFALTGAQKRTYREIAADLSAEKAMSRLVQGDVGSGKTMVALLSVYQAALSGYQSALMAPTEVLARQHLESAKAVLKPFGVRICLLTGNITGRQRKDVLKSIEEGTVDLIIGTHALISDNVLFHDLGLVITDEQHRFGVRQRLSLSSKGDRTNVLVMTATPIPRTLAMILYGDMDISLLDEMPPGRIPIKTYRVDRSYEARLYEFMRRQIEEGHQVYIICPLVEEKQPEEETEIELSHAASDEPVETLDLRPAAGYARFLQKEVFPEYTVGLLHGKMKAVEKDAQMEAFANGSTKILVSTTVVEVGVNVPNATLMVVENAERFGLAQLHQLRGRVGRGKSESYCVLVSDSHSTLTKKRLKTLVDSTDGFYIAEEDLRLRGAGDVFGLRQHGLPDFKLADLYRDTKLLHHAQEMARMIYEVDPKLELLEHRGIKTALDAFWKRAIVEG